MSKNKRIIIWATLLMLLLALPATTFASKQLFKANLRGDVARGAMIIGASPSGAPYVLQVSGLSEQPWGAHIHGPDGNIVATLCAGATCTMSNGFLRVEGTLTGRDISMTQAAFLSALNNGELYVNVHTSQGVEATGTIFPHQ